MATEDAALGKLTADFPEAARVLADFGERLPQRGQYMFPSTRPGSKAWPHKRQRTSVDSPDSPERSGTDAALGPGGCIGFIAYRL